MKIDSTLTKEDFAINITGGTKAAILWLIVIPNRMLPRTAR
jgi:sigma54-dependent transcription regulator